MFIVVEGPDGSGKTHLIQRLSEALSIPVAPRPVDTHGPITDLIEWTTNDLNHKAQHPLAHFLHDRYTLISEPIYGPIMRGHMVEGFETPWFKDAWQAFLMLSPVLIMCLPSLETVRDNVMASEQMQGVEDNLPFIYWSYYTLMVRCMAARHPTTVPWAYDMEDPEAYYDDVVHSLQHIRRHEDFERENPPQSLAEIIHSLLNPEGGE